MTLYERLTKHPSFTLAPAASTAQLEVLGTLHANLPFEYVEFLRSANGGEGWIGDNYVQLWGVERVVELTTLFREIWTHLNVEGLLFVGGDGGSEQLVLDARTDKPSVILLPNACSGLADTPWRLHTLEAVVEFLERENDWFGDESAS